MARELVRHRGRRTPANPEVEAKHKRLIAEAMRERARAERDLEQSKKVLAQRIDRAMFDGVETQEIGKWMGISRQMVYKLVRFYVDNKPLNGSVRSNGKETT